MVGLPHTTAWEMAKRCGRYLSGKPRMVRRFVAQLPVDTTTLIVDSDHAGCSRTRMSTTGMSAYRGKHVIKAASNTQTVIVVSSRESDTLWCLVQPQRWASRVWPENTVGAGMVRHVETQWLWVQGVLHRRGALIPKTPVTSSRTAYERSRDKPYRKELPILGECVFYLPLDRTRGRANKAVSEVLQWSASRTEAGNQRDRCTSAQRQVLSASQRSSEKQSQNCVWDRLNAVLGAPWKKTPGAQREGDEVPAARYPIAEGGGEQPLPVLASSSWFTQCLYPCRCGNR